MRFLISTLLCLLFGCSLPSKSVPLVSCEERFEQCQADFFQLISQCVADQVSMGQLEQCSKFDSFVQECLEE